MGVHELLVALHQRTRVLVDGAGLLLLLGREQGQSRFRPLDALLKARYTSTRQTKAALSLLNLLVDRAQVPGEVVAVQGERYHQLAQDFAHVDTSDDSFQGEKEKF